MGYEKLAFMLYYLNHNYPDVTTLIIKRIIWKLEFTPEIKIINPFIDKWIRISVVDLHLNIFLRMHQKAGLFHDQKYYYTLLKRTNFLVNKMFQENDTWFSYNSLFELGDGGPSHFTFSDEKSSFSRITSFKLLLKVNFGIQI